MNSMAEQTESKQEQVKHMKVIPFNRTVENINDDA
jgi:hypothetical protein